MTKIKKYEKIVEQDYSTEKCKNIWLKISADKDEKKYSEDTDFDEILKKCKNNTIYLWFGNTEESEKKNEYYKLINDIAEYNNVYVIIPDTDKSRINLNNVLVHSVKKLDNIDGFLCIIKDDKKAYYHYEGFPVIEIENYKHIAHSFVHCFWKKACSEKVGKDSWKEYDFKKVTENCSINLPKDEDVEYNDELITQTLSSSILTVPFITDKDRIIKAFENKIDNNLTIYVNFFKGNSNNIINYNQLFALNINLFYRIIIDESNSKGILFLTNPIKELDINSNNKYYIELGRNKCEEFAEKLKENIEYKFYNEINFNELSGKIYYDESNNKDIEFKNKIKETLRRIIYEDFISKEHMENAKHPEIDSYTPKACKVRFEYDIFPKLIDKKHCIYEEYKKINEQLKDKVNKVNNLIQEYKDNDDVKKFSDYTTNDGLLNLHNSIYDYCILQHKINNCRSIEDIKNEKKNINEYLEAINPKIEQLKQKIKEELSYIGNRLEEIQSSNIQDNTKKNRDIEEQRKKLESNKEKLHGISVFLDKKFIVPTADKNKYVPSKNQKKGNYILENFECDVPDFDIPNSGVLLTHEDNLYLGIKYWEELEPARKEIKEKYKKAKICLTNEG